MKFRHKMLVFGSVVAALTALAVFLAGGAIIRASVRDRVTERLDREVTLLGDWLTAHPELLPSSGSPLDSMEACDAFADFTGGALGLRVTLIDPRGRVLGDSSRDGPALAQEENHAGRPEIVEARTSGLGWSERRSSTVEDRLYYVARRVDRDGRPVGYVRVAISVAQIGRATGRYNASLAAMSFLILLAMAVGGYAAARRFSRPLEEMSLRADAIAAGRNDLDVEYASGDEIGQLGAAFNRMTRSVSEQIRALSREKRLRDSIFAGMQEGILVVDTNRRVLLGNDALKAILGLRGSDPSGRSLIEIVRDREVIEAFDGALLRGEDFRDLVSAGAGSDRSYELTIAPLTDASGVKVGAIGIFFDVTRLTALESVRREFVADASHELRTPLTSIKAFVETLLAGGLDDSSNNRRFLEIIKKHSDRMEAILDDLTDLSLIETGAVALEIERLDVSGLIADLVDSLRPRAEARGVTLAAEVPPGTMLAADRRRIEQVFLNLIDNAIKFNKPGGKVTIRAGHVPHPEEPAVLRLVVEDTGIGIPPAALERVFHRFYRVDRARSREMGGTGLGLSIVKHLVRLHGGSVRVESAPGQGARFVIEFPREAAGTSAA